MNKSFSYEVKQWNDIKDDYLGASLIIGNGASIALHQEFDFRSLKKKAEELQLFDEDVATLFKEFNTSDFELILRLVWHAKLVNEKLKIKDQKTDEAYQNIKNALIKVVRAVHCPRTHIEDQLPQLYKFTKSFSTIVSLNYDLLMYWIRMYGNDTTINDDGHVFKDCFKKGGLFDHDWEKFRQSYRQEKSITLTFYQHGNLAIFRDIFNAEKKLKTSEDLKLLPMITQYWTDDKIPLFIAEGTGEKKQESIKTSPYLSTIYYEVLPSLIGKDKDHNLVIYGWGMEQQESHLVKQIFKYQSKAKVAISTYSKDQKECHRIYTEIKKLAPQVEVEFFDSQSSGCWNNP
ncbi:DUF4917 family protein [Acinetobacter sp. ANC 4178]|uniref:DUF4917 family protein n=1 Tax=Acinetobacter sp. ANC 4178 TaxID=2529839 RepID=UPI001D0D8BD9|nr:DUF4917 family protein [Acinetobacter sp. ANC 4178]